MQRKAHTNTAGSDMADGRLPQSKPWRKRDGSTVLLACALLIGCGVLMWPDSRRPRTPTAELSEAPQSTPRPYHGNFAPVTDT